MSPTEEHKLNSSTPEASPYRLGQVVAFESENEGQDKKYLAFHSGNLEIAEIDRDAWQALQNQNTGTEALDELSAWAGEFDQDVEKLEHKGEPVALQMNIAQICNLKCDYCAAGGDGTYGAKEYKIDLSAAYKQVAHMIGRLDSGQSFRINFIGGEPLLYPKEIGQIANYAKLASAGKSIDVLFNVTTNGTLIDSKVAELLATLNAGVTISLDGPPEINDVLRPAKRKDLSSTQMTEAGIQEILKVRHRLRKFAFNSVFGIHNTELIKTYKYLSQWSPDSILFSFASEEGDQSASEKYVEELTEVLRIAYAKDGRSGLAKILPFSNMLHHLESQTRKMNFCGAGKSMLHLDTKGDLYACNWFIDRGDEQVGTAGSPDKEKISQYSRSFIDLHDCQTCWAKFLCGGGCMLFNYEKNGDKHMSDPQFCWRTRKIAKLAIEYFYKLNAQ